MAWGSFEDERVRRVPTGRSKKVSSAAERMVPSRTVLACRARGGTRDGAPERRRMARLTLLGVGAMRSPRFAPAGLLVEHGHDRVMLDGGPGADPRGRLDAWLVTDLRAELIREIRALAWAFRLEPEVDDYVRDGRLRIHPMPVVHTSHPTYGYRIELAGLRVVWAPEFLELPDWADGADLMFADGAGWNRPIRFAGGVGGHACVLDVAREAR